MHTYMMEQLFTTVVEHELFELQASQKLETALVMQKGYVTYYSQDTDPTWLKQLVKYDDIFQKWLKNARQFVNTDQEREALNQIEAQYIRYSFSRDQVIDLYKKGKKEEGFKLHKDVRPQFFQIIDLCRTFRRFQEETLSSARKKLHRQARVINKLALVALLLVVATGLLLAYTLLKQVLGPIRELAVDGVSEGESAHVENEVKAVGLRLHDLMRDVDQTKSKLEWSREHLLQAEKWAMVGKLAAGVAHTVRNPMTSVKMRLFSLERTLDLTSDQKEDLEVISEEIRHIDSVVNNFLEFSRPPKLKMQSASPSDAVDLAVQLLRHRLESYDVQVDLKRDERLPNIQCDTEQLKEVLINLMVNACEAMVTEGTITIEEQATKHQNIGPVMVIKLTDTGPGVSEPLREKMFQPFFTTKEEGTGLGLSIAARIVEEHGGWLDYEPGPGKGSTFVLTLPAPEE